MSRFCGSVIPFSFGKQKLKNIVQYGYSRYQVLIPFHLQDLNAYQKLTNFAPSVNSGLTTPGAPKISIGYGQYSNGIHKPILTDAQDSLGSENYPDYNPKLDSRPLVNHYHEILIRGVERPAVVPKTLFWNFAVNLEIEIYKMTPFLDQKLRKNEESYRIYELLNNKNEVIVQ